MDKKNVKINQALKSHFDTFMQRVEHKLNELNKNLENKLRSNQYKYEFEEYNRLNYIIKQGSQLFGEIKSINHPLSILNFNIFFVVLFKKSQIRVGEKLL